MAGEFVAGSVLIELKAQVANLNANLALAKSRVDAFGQSVVVNSTKVESASTGMAQALSQLTTAAERVREANSGIVKSSNEVDNAFTRQFIALKDFARQVNAGAAATKATVGQSSEAFGELDRATLKSAERFAKFSAIMFATQASVTDFAQTGEKQISAFAIAADAGSKALQGFLLIVSAMPTKGGIAIGAILAIVAAFGAARKAIADVEDKMRDLNKRLDENRQKVIAARAEGDVSILGLPKDQRLVAGDIEAVENQLNRLAIFQRQLTEAENQRDAQRGALLREIEAAKEDLRNQQEAARASAAAGGGISAGAGIPGAAAKVDELSKKLQALERNVINAESALRNSGLTAEGAAEKLERLKDALDLTKGTEEARKLEAAIKDVAGTAATELKAGLIEPLEALARQEGAIRSALDRYIQAQQELLRAASLLKGVDDEAAALLEARAAELGTTIGTLTQRVKDIDEKKLSQERVNNLAQGFSTSFSSALGEAILNAQKPMEALANLGGRLFENAIAKAMDQVQSGLQTAFKAIAGGSDIIGGALTAAFGIGGAVLSRLGSKSQSSFGSVQSAVTSSRELRGVISGPSSVAVAAVGENIQRAMEPMVSRQDIANELLSIIERNTRALRGAGAAAGGPVPAVAAATDLA